MVALNNDERKLRTEFLAFLPKLKHVLRIKFRHLRTEARGEAVSEAIALSFAMWLSARRRQRDVGVYSLAHYSALAVRSGRTLASKRSTDLLGPANRVRTKVPPVRRFGSMSQATLDDLLANRREKWPVPDRVAFKMDWTAFLNRQSQRTKQIIGLLASGHRRFEAADIVRVSRPAITQRMNKARNEWRAFSSDADSSVSSPGPQLTAC